jgi:hypothetical protein
MGLVEFVLAPPDIVRSANQLWLLKNWMRARDCGRLPALDALSGSELAGRSGNLLFADVMRGAGPIRFLVRSCGARIMEYLGVDCPTGGEGRYMDEALPPAYRDAALSSFLETVATCEPVYTIADMRDGTGRIVHFERLLLPFSQDGTIVDRVLASVEAVSPEGAFESRDLMAASPPAFAFCAVIDTIGRWQG